MAQYRILRVNEHQHTDPRLRSHFDPTDIEWTASDVYVDIAFSKEITPEFERKLKALKPRLLTRMSFEVLSNARNCFRVEFKGKNTIGNRDEYIRKVREMVANLPKED